MNDIIKSSSSGEYKLEYCNDFNTMYISKDNNIHMPGYSGLRNTYLYISGKNCMGNGYYTCGLVTCFDGYMSTQRLLKVLGKIGIDVTAKEIYNRLKR